MTATPDGRGSFRSGLRLGMAFAVPVFVIAVSFGVLARELGWGVTAPIVFSATTFSGSAQYAAAGVLGAGGTVVAAIVAGLLVNARYAVMGISVTPSLRGGRLRRAAEAQVLVDSSWAAASRGGGRFDRGILVGTTIPQYVAWVGGTIVGVVVGDALGDPEKVGLDVIFPAFFLVLLISELRRGRRHVAAALIAAGVALTLVPVAPPGIPIIAACAGALVALWRRAEA